MGLARALGRVVEGADWRVLELPAEYFSPVALPRTVVLHQVDGGRSLRNVLGPWQEHLSSVATDDSMRQYHSGPEWGEVFGWFHRIEPIGRLQRPAFPRRHDGVAMLGAVLGS